MVVVGPVLRQLPLGDVVCIRAFSSAGEVIFGPSVAARVLMLFSATTAVQPGQPAFPELTYREQEILELVARGLTNPAIASRLFLSEKTVRNDVSNVSPGSM